MRIYSKKAFEFTRYDKVNGEQIPVEKATIKAKTFGSVPKWVMNDPMFAWAQKDGDIEIMATKAQQKKIENEVADEETTKK
jgi:hypothetical protein